MQPPSSTTTPSAGTAGRSLRFATAAVLMLAVALLLRPGPHRNHSLPVSLSSLPMRIDDWSGTDNTPDKETLALFGTVEFLIREYKNASESQPRILLIVKYFPTHASDAIFDSLKRPIPYMAWPSTPREAVQIARPDGTSFRVNRYVESRFRDRILVLYWFQVHGRALASEGWAKYYLMSDLIRMNRNDAAVVRLETPMLNGESQDAAQVRVMRFGFQLLPMLDRCIPR